MAPVTSVDPIAPVGLGRTDLTIGALGLGGAPLATIFWGNDEATACAAVERALASGIRLFDTAPLYGLGESEHRIGSVLGRTERDRFVVTTKVGRLIRQSQQVPGDREPVFDFSRDGVLRSLEESLQRLALDHVDIVHIHDPDDHLEEALNGAYPALHDLRAQGVITAISAGANHPGPLATLVREADMDCVMLAGRYTLLDQTGIDELLPLCQQRDVAVIAAGVFNSGILADPTPGSWYDYAPAEPQIVERAQALSDLCARHEVPLQAAAIQFPLAHPAVVCDVIGMRSAAEVDEDLRLAAITIPSELWPAMRDAGLLHPGAPTPEGHEGS